MASKPTSNPKRSNRAPPHTPNVLKPTILMSRFSRISGLCGTLLLAAIHAACSPAGVGSGSSGEGTMGDLVSADPGVGGISEVPNPSPTMASQSGVPIARLQRGHEVYMLRCGECHEYMLPERVDIMDWEDAIPDMIKHAGLATSDEKAVLDYVIAVKKSKGQEI